LVGLSRHYSTAYILYLLYVTGSTNSRWLAIVNSVAIVI